MTFSNRHDVETHLAEQADGGVIVEVGSGKGDGLVALLNGTRYGRLLPVYAVDPYSPYVDKLGGTYGPESKQEAMDKILGTGLERLVAFVEADGVEVGATWDLPTSLVWIDVSMEYEGLKPIFDAWANKVMDDGHIAIAGLDYGTLGTRRVMEEAIASERFDRVLTEQDFVAVLRKRPEHRRAAFYIVHGEPYADEAAYSASSLKEHLPAVETFLFAVGGTGARDCIDHVVALPERESPLWYLDSTRYFNLAVERLHEYNRLLYLDTDTWVAWNCLDMWWLLERFDICLGHSAGREAMPSAIGTPPAFTTLSIGVSLFCNNAEVRATLADWLAFYEKYAPIYGDNDESPLRDVLWLNRHGLRIYILPPEYNVRAGFGCWLYGRARVVHARMPRLRRVAEQLNSVTSMRIWHPSSPDEFLWYWHPQ